MLTIQYSSKHLLFWTQESDSGVQKSYRKAIFDRFLYCNYEGIE